MTNPSIQKAKTHYRQDNPLLGQYQKSIHEFHDPVSLSHLVHHILFSVMALSAKISHHLLAIEPNNL